MKLAIVGSRLFEGNKLVDAIVGDIIFTNSPKEILSGGAKGVDEMADMWACGFGIGTKIYRPQIYQWAGGFKERNMRIADECDVLYAILSPKSKTYGAGWTADYAEKIGKEVHRITIE